jgi:hypothetical protein
MIRTLNFIFIAMTGLVCLGIYNLAEEARVAKAELRATETAIHRENETLTVLGAEWARLTQPARIHALAKRHLDLIERPTLQLSSLTQLPRKNPMASPDGEIRAAKAVAPAAPRVKPAIVAFVPLAGR